MSIEFNGKVAKLTKEMVKVVVDQEDFSSLSSPFVPDRKKIIDIINNIKKILFPLQFGTREIYNCTLDYYIGSLLIETEQLLHKQIGIALMRNESFSKLTVSQEVADKAADYSVEFMEKLPKIHKDLMLDVEAFYDGDPAANSVDEIIISYPGLLAIMIYRIAHELYEMNIPIIPRMMSEYAHSRTGVDINPGAKIGKYFFIDHATGVVIGETCDIKDNVKIYQGVTLGALSTHGGQTLHGVKRHPTIENNVTIYANATVLGGDTVIGENAVIGGSCFITKSIPANAHVQTVSEIKMNQHGDF